MQSLGKMRVLKYKYFGQVDFMEVLPRLTHFSRLSNCSRKRSPISHQMRIFMRNIFLAPKIKQFYREIQCLSYTVWLSQREVFLQYPLLPQFPSEKIILDKLKNFTQQLLNSDWLKKTYQIFRQFSKNVCKTPVFNYFLSSLLCTCPVLVHVIMLLCISGGKSRPVICSDWSLVNLQSYTMKHHESRTYQRNWGKKASA